MSHGYEFVKLLSPNYSQSAVECKWNGEMPPPQSTKHEFFDKVSLKKARNFLTWLPHSIFTDKMIGFTTSDPNLLSTPK